MFGELLTPMHLIILVALVILLFGGKAFARLGKGFSEGMQNFRRSRR